MPRSIPSPQTPEFFSSRYYGNIHAIKQSECSARLQEVYSSVHVLQLHQSHKTSWQELWSCRQSLPEEQGKKTRCTAVKRRDLSASWGPRRWKLGQTKVFSRSGIWNWTHASIAICQYKKIAKSNNWSWLQMRNNTQGNHISGDTKSCATQDCTSEVCRLSASAYHWMQYVIPPRICKT